MGQLSPGFSQGGTDITWKRRPKDNLYRSYLSWLKRPRDSNDDQVGGTRHLFEVDHSVLIL